MNDLPEVITKQTVGDVSVPLTAKLLDLVRSDQELVIEWTAPNYRRIELLWGLFRYESGERRTLTIKGKPGYCDAVIKELRANGTVESRRYVYR